MLVRGSKLEVVKGSYTMLEYLGNDHFPVTLEVDVVLVPTTPGAARRKKTSVKHVIKKKGISKKKQKKINTLRHRV